MSMSATFKGYSLVEYFIVAQMGSDVKRDKPRVNLSVTVCTEAYTFCNLLHNSLFVLPSHPGGITELIILSSVMKVNGNWFTLTTYDTGCLECIEPFFLAMIGSPVPLIHRLSVLAVILTSLFLYPSRIVNAILFHVFFLIGGHKKREIELSPYYSTSQKT